MNHAGFCNSVCRFHANKWLKRTPPSVTPPAGEAQASRHPSATPLSHTVGPMVPWMWYSTVVGGAGVRQ